MDCSITQTKFPGVFMITTTDFFYPLIDDPYLQGKIGCANVLSDLYSMGVVDCDTMLMLLAASREMPERERDIVTRELIRGFNDLAREADTRVTGGQTVQNPWPIIGGVATSIVSADMFIRPENAVAGDVIVLTKPLGTQVAVNLHQWHHKSRRFGTATRWDTVKSFVSEDDVRYAYETAARSMARLNRTGARLMHKYHAHAATDVTGFGILGHAQNLASNQLASVDLEIHALPVIRMMWRIDSEVNVFRLPLGYSAETSGGLLICLPAEQAEGFCREIQELDGAPAWIVGRVVEGTRQARLVAEPTIIEV